MGSPDGLHAGLGQPEVADLPLLDQLLDRAGHVLDRDLGVDAMLVEEVDEIGPQPTQRPVERLANVLGPTVQLPVALIQREAELGRDDDLVAAWGERLADDLFVVVRPVDLRGVEEGHAMVDCLAQEVDHRRPVGRGTERLADPHAAQPDRRDLQPGAAQCPLFHDGYSHSMVPGGLLVTSRVTRLISLTSLVMRVEMRSRTSYGSRAQSAVMASSEVTGRITTGWP